jgi:mannose-1-phosphate guanylyltransferase
MVTFAVKPTYAATGFGYVERAEEVREHPGAFRVRQFVEKPPVEKAREYVASGRFGWNSGMFVFSARAFMRAMERYLPENAAGLRRIQGALGTARERAVLDEVYPSLKKISLDYAIMEPASRETPSPVFGVTMDLDWLDVGSWPSYAETLAPDASGNRASGPARSVVVGGSGNVVVSGAGPAHTVAILGCRDLVVVHTPEATLVMPLSEAQRLKDLHALLPEDLR